MLPTKMHMAVKFWLPERMPVFTKSGTAAKIVIIMAMKCVIALPGSLIVICINIHQPFLSKKLCNIIPCKVRKVTLTGRNKPIANIPITVYVVFKTTCHGMIIDYEEINVKRKEKKSEK